METNFLRLSWTSIQAFMACNRRYQLSYVEGLYKPDDKDSQARVIGSHVHAGWEAAVKAKFMYPHIGVESILESALQGLRNWRFRNLQNTKQRYNWDTSEYEPDVDYFSMMDYAFETAEAVLRYQIPRFDWDRYQPVSLEDLFGGSERNTAEDIKKISPNLKGVDEPLVEWKISVPMQEGVTFVGVIDAVFYDHQQNEYVFIDWKTRSRFHDDRLISMDGQLPLYASIINALYGETLIQRVIVYQVHTDVPGPAKLTEKTNRLSEAAPGSTWEVWAESVRRLGLDPEDYREKMYPKMQQPGHYTRIVSVAINGEVDKRTQENFFEAVAAIRAAVSTGTFPAVLSSKGCEYCDFLAICHPYQGGGEADIIIDKMYLVKEDFLEDEGK